MITAATGFAALAMRLTAKAAALATARAAARRTAQDSRWRRAGLVWPLFAKG